MQAVKIPIFNSTEDLIQAVREKREETGLTPPTCLLKICHERRLVLSASERHRILSEFASHASFARKAKKQKLEGEKGTMFPQIFAINSAMQKIETNKETTSTLLTQSRKPTVIQDDLLLGMTIRDSYQDRPRHWPRRQR
jgi:hypothetical protein